VILESFEIARALQARHIERIRGLSLDDLGGEE
jgi:hypothetical protein